MKNKVTSRRRYLFFAVSVNKECGLRRLAVMIYFVFFLFFFAPCGAVRGLGLPDPFKNIYLGGFTLCRFCP